MATTQNTKPTTDAINAAHTALNGLIDAVYAQAKTNGQGFDTLKVLGQAAKGLQSAERNVTKAFAAKAARKPAAAKK